jgi:hypothetical protein
VVVSSPEKLEKVGDTPCPAISRSRPLRGFTDTNIQSANEGARCSTRTKQNLLLAEFISLATPQS